MENGKIKNQGTFAELLDMDDDFRKSAKINNLFRELGDNFFPMAHTTAPLRDLKIVNARQYEDLNNRVEHLLMEFAHHHTNYSIEANERNIRLNRDVIDAVENLRAEIRDVLNP